MKLLDEFKSFALRGNVIDLAVGVIIGSAFGKIVSSLVNDIIMPPVGFLIGGVDFKDLKLKLSDSATVNYGNFVQSIIDFAIIAATIFIMIKVANRLWKRPTARLSASTPTKQEELLEEIRDLLKK